MHRSAPDAVLTPAAPAGVPALQPRGPLSAQLLDVLREEPGPIPQLAVEARALVAASPDVLVDGDLQLALMVLHELHHQGWPGVDDRWEWLPDLMALAAELEQPTELALRELAADWLPEVAPAPDQVAVALTELTRRDVGPSVSKHLARSGTPAQYAELLVHRSVYHLKEADPHTWAIPRLTGKPKAALVEIQADEYGGGRPEWMHAVLFAGTMRGLGLDPRYGRYLNDVPAVTLGWANTMTLFGLHRRLVGAAVGHLAALEMTSSMPMRRYGNGLRRLGFDQATTRFYDEHVEADAVHEQIAAHDLAGRLALDRPELVGDILFGAAAALAIDVVLTEHLMDSWQRGVSSLLPAADPADSASNATVNAVG